MDSQELELIILPDVIGYTPFAVYSADQEIHLYGYQHDGNNMIIYKCIIGTGKHAKVQSLAIGDFYMGNAGIADIQNSQLFVFDPTKKIVFGNCLKPKLSNVSKIYDFIRVNETRHLLYIRKKDKEGSREDMGTRH